MGDRVRFVLVGIITVLICGIMIYASFTPVVDLSPRAVAFMEREIGIP